MRKALMLAFAGVSLATAPAAPAQKAAVDWSNRVATTAGGAHVMGNPAAPVKLVEYLSYTCNHCAYFAIAASAPLKSEFVASGRTSVELRHAVRDRLDFTAALLARCGGATDFFRNSDAIFAAQPEWMARGHRFEHGDGAHLATLPVAGAVKALAEGSGLYALMQRLGYSDAQLDACLADAEQQRLVGAMTEQAWEVAKISGTPHFTINGTPQPVTSWPALEPRLRAAQN